MEGSFILVIPTDFSPSGGICGSFQAVRFWTVTKFPNYVIVYRPDTVPLQVVAVLHGKRDLKEVLESLP
jgi:hypothetical protein